MRETSIPSTWAPPPTDGVAKVVLLVDDEPATQRFYTAGLKGLQGWRVLTAENGYRALEILRREAVDVVVTDLNMPVMDGYRLISVVYEVYPSIPVIVITSLPQGDSQDRALALGALRVLSKPVKLSLLMEEVRRQSEREPEGLVKGVRLASLLQLMGWEKKTCTLTVRSGDAVGRLYIQKGRLANALHGAQEGLEAAYEILLWPRPQIEFVDTCRVACAIDLSLDEFLMNVALIEDQRRAPGTPDPLDDMWDLR